jgi:hypothetical protein
MAHKLGVVVPYRDREPHLRFFVPYVFNFLTNQGIEHRIVVVEQHKHDKLFNRAKLMNIGFDISKDDCDYFAFHDVDLIPQVADYSYPRCPTHMSAHCSQFNYELPYETIFGGVAMFTKEDFIKVNGYSNEYWGWGAEDDDMYNRCEREATGFERRPNRYDSLSHEKQSLTHHDYMKNIERLQAQKAGKTNHKEDGLSSLNYTRIAEVSLGLSGKKYTVAI